MYYYKYSFSYDEVAERYYIEKNVDILKTLQEINVASLMFC